MRDVKRVGWMLVIAGLTAAAPALAQDEPERWKAEVPQAGFWPTQVMIDLAIDRMTEEMADHYELDDEQMYETRAAIKERVPQWLNENRAEIQTLMNQFFEAQLSGEAPEPNAVAVWSQRALPLINDFKGVVNTMSDDFREFWTDDQVIQLEGELAAFNTGIAMVNNKVAIWADGGYDPETEWIPDRAARRDREREEEEKRREEMEKAKQDKLVELSGGAAPAAGSDAGGQPLSGDDAPLAKSGTTAPAKPKDAWAQYTDEFIARYKLNDEQRQKAMLHLKKAQDSRERYMRKSATRRVEAEAALKAAETPEEKAEAQKLLDRMNTTVDRYFDQLKDDLNRLPTRKQRAEAATLATTPSADSAETAAAPAGKRTGAPKTPGRQ